MTSHSLLMELQNSTDILDDYQFTKNLNILSSFLLLFCHCHVRLFLTPGTVPGQASISLTISWSLLKLMSFELVIPLNHLIFYCPFSSCLQSFLESETFPTSLLFASGGQVIWVSASVLPMNIQSWFPLGLISLILSPRIQEILKSLFQQHHLKASVLQCSVCLWPNSHLCTWLLKKEHSFDYKDFCWQSDLSGF